MTQSISLVKLFDYETFIDEIEALIDSYYNFPRIFLFDWDFQRLAKQVLNRLSNWHVVNSLTDEKLIKKLASFLRRRSETIAASPYCFTGIINPANLLCVDIAKLLEKYTGISYHRFILPQLDCSQFPNEVDLSHLVLTEDGKSVINVIQYFEKAKTSGFSESESSLSEMELNRVRYHSVLSELLYEAIEAYHLAKNNQINRQQLERIVLLSKICSQFMELANQIKDKICKEQEKKRNPNKVELYQLVEPPGTMVSEIFASLIATVFAQLKQKNQNTFENQASILRSNGKLVEKIAACLISQFHPNEMFNFILKIDANYFARFRVFFREQLTKDLRQSFDFYEHYRLEFSAKDNFIRQLVKEIQQTPATLPEFVLSYYETVNSTPRESLTTKLQSDFFAKEQVQRFCKTDKDILFIINAPVLILNNESAWLYYKKLIEALEPLFSELLPGLDNWVNLLSKVNNFRTLKLFSLIKGPVLALIKSDTDLEKLINHLGRDVLVVFLENIEFSTLQKEKISIPVYARLTQGQQKDYLHFYSDKISKLSNDLFVNLLVHSEKENLPVITEQFSTLMQRTFPYTYHYVKQPYSEDWLNKAFLLSQESIVGIRGLADFLNIFLEKAAEYIENNKEKIFKMLNDRDDFFLLTRKLDSRVLKSLLEICEAELKKLLSDDIYHALRKKVSCACEHSMDSSPSTFNYTSRFYHNNIHFFSTKREQSSQVSLCPVVAGAANSSG